MMASRNGDGNSVMLLALVANCSTELISLPPRFAIKVGVISPMKRRFFLMIRRRQTPLPDSGYSRSRLPKSEYSASPDVNEDQKRYHLKGSIERRIIAVPIYGVADRRCYVRRRALWPFGRHCRRSGGMFRGSFSFCSLPIQVCAAHRHFGHFFRFPPALTKRAMAAEALSLQRSTS